MKEFFKNIRDNLLEVLLKHNVSISIIINIIILFFLNESIVKYFIDSKSDILNMLISISGTLFGFILTFLSIFIIFRTEEKYKKNKENQGKPLIMLINNDSFNDMYELFIKSSYSLGLLLIVSIIFYFINYGSSYIVNMVFISIILELIILCTIRVFLSIYTFNTLLRILINGNNKE